MKFAVVKTVEQYRAYLARIEELVGEDPPLGTPAGDELELLALLVEEYEKSKFKFDLPDPVEAVQFRMLEQDLRQADLVQYIGSKSRVSEFLSCRRPLTIQMIRNLSEGLGIPIEVLAKEPTVKPGTTPPPIEEAYDWTKFPVKEMLDRCWISVDRKAQRTSEASEQVRQFIENALGGTKAGVLARRSITGDAFSWKTQYALIAWQARVLERAQEGAFSATKQFQIEALNQEALGSLVSLSVFDDGPVRAVKYLRDLGIAVVIEPHLKRTRLDGAAMLSPNGVPVIALTLRYDRLDNFWFTLLHEVAHVWKHLSNPGDVILDRLFDLESKDKIEKEANRLARDILIPRSAWTTATVRQMPTKAGINALADELRIHPAIIAGRVQYEQKNYALFQDMVGRGSISKLFPSVV